MLDLVNDLAVDVRHIALKGRSAEFRFRVPDQAIMAGPQGEVIGMMSLRSSVTTDSEFDIGFSNGVIGAWEPKSVRVRTSSQCYASGHHAST